MTNESLPEAPVHVASRVHAWLGKTFIGKPEALRMPPWFYYVQADRPQPTAEEFDTTEYQRNAIAIDFARRAVMRRLGSIAVAGSVACSTALIVVAAVLSYVF